MVFIYLESRRHMPRALIFVNGYLPDLEPVRRLIQPGDTLLAADGGTRHLLALGLFPSAIIGDLDSLTDDERQKTESAGVDIRQVPRDKNETDLELALHYAVGTGHRQIIVVAALGGRLDQSLGNLSLLTDSALADLYIRLDDGVEEAFFVRKQAQVEGRCGDIVSLLPWGGEVTGVTTDGLRWPLRGETLLPHQTRGISNEMLGESASVNLTSGLLLVTHRRQTQIENRQS
jgi:thiamine pyrophosphokinase